MKRFLIGGLALAAVSSSFGQFVIDGSKDAGYNSGGSFQTTPTGFGNSTLGQVGAANGSELDGLIAEITPNNLVMLFTGNLQSNFNKLEIFIDVDGATSGQNILAANAGSGLSGMSGLRFDTGFVPEYWFRVNGDGTNFFVDSGVLGASSVTQTYRGTNTYGAGSAGALTGGTNGGVLAAINNSNTAGVDGSSVGTPSAVTTGVEISIPVSLLGNVTWGQGLRVSAFINGDSGNFLSNQVLGGLPSGTANLGNPTSVNFNNIAGNQFVAVPEPASMAVLGLGIFGLARRRRNK
ncbi:MAG: PEP-CTERM sorting domain-containing protein [Armatimonadota bacterium]